MKNLFILFKCVFLCTIISIGIISCTDNDEIIEPVSPTAISITQVSSPLNIGDTEQLSVTILPEDTTDKSITWLSSDAEIATVDENGLVTCFNSGDVVIQAATNNNIKATVPLSVAEPAFLIPEELVGYWVGVEIALVEISTDMVYNEEDLHGMLGDLPEDYKNEWFTTLRSLYNYRANGDATMEWELDVELENNTYERTVVNGVLTNMDNIDDAYFGTFDISAISPEDGESIQEMYIDNDRIRIKMPWSNSFELITYYAVIKDYSYKRNTSDSKVYNSDLNDLVPFKLRRNK